MKLGVIYPLILIGGWECFIQTVTVANLLTDKLLRKDPVFYLIRIMIHCLPIVEQLCSRQSYLIKELVETWLTSRSMTLVIWQSRVAGCEEILTRGINWTSPISSKVRGLANGRMKSILTAHQSIYKGVNTVRVTETRYHSLEPKLFLGDHLSTSETRPINNRKVLVIQGR